MSKDKDSFNQFSSAMDDLEDILANEGIDISQKQKKDKTPPVDVDQIPVLRTFKLPSQEPSAKMEQSSARPLNTDSSPEPTNTSISESSDPKTDQEITASSASSTMDLDDYISDFDDDLIDIDSEKELEKAVESITNPDELYKFEHDELQHLQIDAIRNNLEKNFAQHLSQKTKDHHQQIETLEKDLKEGHSQELSLQRETHVQQIEALKKELKKNLDKQVEKSVAKLKTNLLKSIHSEIDKLFKKIYS